jgi:hypothetical protein
LATRPGSSLQGDPGKLRVEKGDQLFVTETPGIELPPYRPDFGLAKNHAFVDGNKLTALVVCLSFLRQNGFAINASQEARYLTFYGLAAGDVSEEKLAEWLQQCSEPV